VILSAVAAIAAIDGRAPGAEPVDGKALYQSNCSNCHGVISVGGRSRVDSMPIPVDFQLAVALPHGPTLKGVVGRKAGTVAGYGYSPAFLAAMRDVVWTRATLDRWISDTRAWVPDAIMVYRQPDAAIRARIIDYLEHPEPESIR
jgi:cytochrome c